jgi:hypothetical protein
MKITGNGKTLEVPKGAFKSIYEPLGYEPVDAPPAVDDAETAIRTEAKALGIPSHHNMGLEKLKGKIAEKGAELLAKAGELGIEIPPDATNTVLMELIAEKQAG